MLNQLIEIDKSITLLLNGSKYLYIDHFAQCATATITWLPLVLVLLYVLVRNNTRTNTIGIIFTLAICILLADQIASGICKPYFQRVRPAQDLNLLHVVDIVDGYRGGLYGFFSSHAANTFAVATYLSLLIRHRGLSLMLYSWALLNCWTRIYLGVHYFGDIIVGMLCGALIGAMLYVIWKRWIFQGPPPATKGRPGISTESGYTTHSVQIMMLSIWATYLIITIVPFFM